MAELTGKVALVTGAGRGIGRAIALALAGEGATVAVTGRNVPRLEQVVGEVETAGGEAAQWQMDVSDEAQVESSVNSILKRWGQIDILVNNAAIIHDSVPVWEASIADWDLSLIHI